MKSKAPILLVLALAVAVAFPAAAFAADGNDLVASPFLATQAASVSSPRVVTDSTMEAGQISTWDCVWFGSYPQSEVTSSDPAYASLQSANWDANGDASVGDARYRRLSMQDAASSDNWSSGSGAYRYFKYEPVKWRVLSVSGGTAYVVADIALDSQLYNTNYASVSWKTSSIRSWLNGYGASSNQPGADYTSKNFIDAAFSGLAGFLECPVLMTDTNSLSATTKAEIERLGARTAFVAGGTAAVSSDVEGQLSGIAVERLAGETAVETSRAIAAYCAANGMSKAKVAVATTDGYWDALTGAALCGKARAPMVLASPANAAGAADGFVSSEASTIAVGYIFGGEAAVAPASEAALREATK